MSPIYMKVPFDEKDQAKALGAKWDYERRHWYAPTPEVRQSCLRWPGLAVPPEVQVRHDDLAAVRRQEARHNAGTRLIVGDRYFEMPECDCVPWDPCQTCMRVVQASAWMGGSHV